jgi:Tol biopolymer transport system component
MAVSPDGKRLAFTTRQERTRLWSLPFNPATGQLQADGTAITSAELDAALPEVSRDGQKLAFILTRSGRPELWEHSLKEGRETLLAGPDDYRRFAPRWSRDGSRLAYRRSHFTNAHRGQSESSIVLLPSGGGDEQVLTSPNTFTEIPSDWSADGQWIIGTSDHSIPGRRALCLFPISAAPKAETEMRVLASHPDFNLAQPRFSPDERWICFSAVKAADAGVSALYVMPAAGGEWVRVTEGQSWDDRGYWAPDGKTIYFASNRTGTLNVWGIGFDPKQGRAVGAPFRVTAFDLPGRMIQSGSLSLSLTAERLILPLTEAKGSIWILENLDR